MGTPLSGGTSVVIIVKDWEALLALRLGVWIWLGGNGAQMEVYNKILHESFKIGQIVYNVEIGLRGLFVYTNSSRQCIINKLNSAGR
jgi:hypothetical protein